MSFRFLALVATGLVTLVPLLASGPFGCSSKSTLGGQGATCTVVTDCEDGLICITPKNATSGTCSSNVGSVQQLPPTPDAGPTQSQDAAAFADAPGIVIPEDSGTPTTSTDASGD